jgi:uncharacterized protein (TIGR02145 family)
MEIMKKVITFLIPMAIGILFTASVFAQSPEKMSYQAVIRNAADNLVTNTNVGMRIQILQTSEFGAAVYVETHSPTTNANGLVSIEIGGGSVENGDFKTIDWAKGPYFIKTETDPAGGKNYNITATSQLLSVPYSLHAKTADNGITPAQANAIVANTAKTGITTAQANAIVANTAKVSAATGTKTGDMQYWNGTKWVTVAAGTEGQVLTLVNGVPTWEKPAIPTVGSTDVYNHSTGKVWMDRNLGASRIATSSNDAGAFGDLYQWGRAADGHQKRTSSNTSTISNSDKPGHGKFITSSNDWRNPPNNDLWHGVNGINNPCSSGYRLPTEAEWEAERLSWVSKDVDGAFASPLKLPVAGHRNNSNGSLNQEGTFGYYWSGTISGGVARFLGFHGSNVNMGSFNRAYGFSVRCIKD